MTSIYVQPMMYHSTAYSEPQAIYEDCDNDLVSDNNENCDNDISFDLDENNDIEQSVPDVDKIISLALTYDCIIGARAFNYNDKIVLALLTTPFYLKSERDGTRWRIQTELADALSFDDITVTFDVEVYRKIKDGLNEVQMQKLLQLAKTR